MVKYVPCLRWKQGEYQALLKLSANAKKDIMPLIEISEIGFDFENGHESKTIDEHLAQFARRIRDKWGWGNCFVDARNVDANLMANGDHPLSMIFDDLRAKGILAIPVIDISRFPSYEEAVNRIMSIDNRGVCIRISINDAAKHDFISSLNSLLGKLCLKPGECDLILDLASPNFQPIDGFVKLVGAIIRTLPYLDNWRKFVIIGTAFPRSMGDVQAGLSIRPRYEWLLYKLLMIQLKDAHTRVPIFGDYTINHPEIFRLD